MAVIYCCDGERAWYRDVLVSADELFCGPRVVEGTPKAIHRPNGEYDLAGFIKGLDNPWCNPSLVVVCHDSNHHSLPRNLAGTDCPKVLIVGDTHHNCVEGHGPIALPLAHMLSEKYDLVIGEFNRQHLHFFLEAGIRAAWLPSFSLLPFYHPVDTPKQYSATFIGQTDHHPIRRQILEQLEQMGVPLIRDALGMMHRETSALYSKSRINLNISLNGDLNLRCFEVLAAGGFLMTDRLSPESGLDLLFKDRQHLVMFDDSLHLAELIYHYLSHPTKMGDIAAAGQAQFQRAHDPKIKSQQLLAMVAGQIPDLYNLSGDRRTALPAQSLDQCRRRIAVYEFLQEIHRNNFSQQVLFWPTTERYATDAVDLIRLHIHVSQGNPEGTAVLFDAGLDTRVSWIKAQEIPNRNFDILVCPALAIHNRTWQQCLQFRRWKTVILTDLDPNRDSLMLDTLQKTRAFKCISTHPPVFSAA